jgi:26S proteasome regulatory subunit N10
MPDQLALKHRLNKVQRQRIIVFCCSPVPDDEKTLSRLAKKMKKNSVAVDIIAFGEPDAQTMDKLRQFSETVQSTEGCFFDVIHAGPHLLSDALLGTSLLANEGVGGLNREGFPVVDNNNLDLVNATGTRFEFGANLEDDPEMALALRLSYEEHQAREAAAAKLKEAADKEKLEGIPEEGDERIPLLSEVEGGPAPKDAEESEQKPAEDKDKDKDAMDAS